MKKDSDLEEMNEVNIENDVNNNEGSDDNNEKQVRFNLNNNGNETEQNERSLDINTAHRCWGHPGETRMREMAITAKVKLSGKLQQCNACCVDKAKCKPIANTTESSSQVVGERIFIDTTGPFPMSSGGNRYARGALNDASGYMFLEFGKIKDEMKDFVIKIFKLLKGRNTPCKFLRCDNTGEHMCLKDVCDEYGVTMEYTPPHTPQYNGRIERRFAVIVQRALAMMHDAGFNQSSRHQLWAGGPSANPQRPQGERR